MTNIVVSNIIKVKPCKTINKVIESKDFKRIVDIIFRELARNIDDRNRLLSNLSETKKALDKLLSDKLISASEGENITKFLNQALNRDSLTYKKIEKVLNRVESHSFFDTLCGILQVKHDLTNDIVKNKNINPVIIALFEKINELLDQRIPNLNTDVKKKTSDTLEYDESLVNEIIDKFLLGDYELLLKIIEKARDGVKEEKIYNHELFGKIVEGIIKNQDENSKKVEELEQKKDKDTFYKINLIFGFITNKNSDLDNKITNIYFKLIKKNS